VVVVDRGTLAEISTDDVVRALQAALQTQSVKEAAATVAERFGMSKRDVYQLALKLGDDE
jgi:16S rRNA (cytidine1402-2'-O)-methyltransferase